jgi:hypothetical protein
VDAETWQSPSFCTTFPFVPLTKKGSLALQITYDYDIRGYGGIKYIFSDDRTLLSTWTPQRRAGNSEIPPPPTITPHITIVARLAAGVSGETFIAKCDGGTHLVWKEIPLDDDHLQYARTEVMMYDGPLASLQGTLVQLSFLPSTEYSMNQKTIVRFC